jgi:hypothetical protein
MAWVTNLAEKEMNDQSDLTRKDRWEEARKSLKKMSQLQGDRQIYNLPRKRKKIISYS